MEERCYTVADIMAATGCTRQHINRVCNQVFGPSTAFRRSLTQAQFERIRAMFQKPWRRKKYRDAPNTNDAANLR
jgi:hypothetical protein